MKITFKFISPIILLCLLSAQTQPQFDIPGVESSQTPILYKEYGAVPLALEYPVDPETYYLGPGDRLRINISGGLFEESIYKRIGRLNTLYNFVLI